MSFDLSLSKGTIVIGSDGDLAKVRGTTKVVQDVLKVVHTPVGGNPFYPQIGTTITEDNIGQNISQEFAETKVAASISTSIKIIQDIQRRQELVQTVTPEEKVVGIAELVVGQNENDPRQYDIKLSVTTESINTSVVSMPGFALSTTTD
jgi:nitrogen regulatory protein PII-like uncharacterized protein